MKILTRLKAALKIRTRDMAITFFFFMITTTISVTLIYLPTLISDKIFLSNEDLGAVILGSIFGQVTILMAIRLMDWIFEDGFEDPERLEMIHLIDIEA